MNSIPEWANWLTRDENGSLYAFENKPIKATEIGEWIDIGYRDCTVYETDDTFSHIEWTDEEPTPLPLRKANVGGVRMNDLVNHPSHYKGVMGLETRDVQKNFVPKYEKYGVMVMCDIKDSIKYITRAPDKNDVEDINKAIRMLQYAKEGMERSINETF